MRMTIEQLMDGVDLKRLQLLGRLHDAGDERKFCDYRQHGGDAINRAKHLGLDQGPSVQVLDIGCAFGYFVRACKVLGHDAEGLDRPNPMYAEACSLMSVPVHVYYIAAGEPLPSEVSDYDLINMEGFGLPGREGVTHLDDVPAEALWSDWVFFVTDLLDRLNSKGRLAITLNAGRAWQNNLAEWRAAFASRAEIDYSINRIYLTIR